MRRRSISLACPDCLSELVLMDSVYKCVACAKEYPIKQGVVRFVVRDDEFYEGAYNATVNIIFTSERSLKALLFFYLYRDPYLNALREYVGPQSKILDIGCGGGIRYLAQKGEVVGLDLSFSSLRKAKDFYDMVIQSNALNLPFPNETFDLITSNFTFEHFLPDEKKILLKQMNRILKPGGRLILFFDCDNENHLFIWFKKDLELYRKCFIELDHHYGLQKPSVNIDLIQQAGFSILKYKALNKTVLQYLPVYAWMEPYRNKSKLISFVNCLASIIGKKKFLWVPYNTMINQLDNIVEKLLPLDYARLLLVVTQKES